jgi:hypothetical protein
MANLIEFQPKSAFCRPHQAAVVTFTTMTRKAAASQTSLTLSRGKRSYPDLHTFVQDMKDGLVALWFPTHPLDMFPIRALVNNSSVFKE